ncbi:hypothetical protein E2320_014422, partial [Naja naja]
MRVVLSPSQEFSAPFFSSFFPEKAGSASGFSTLSDPAPLRCIQQSIETNEGPLCNEWVVQREATEPQPSTSKGIQ